MTLKQSQNKRALATSSVTITHPERIVYADMGMTKRQVVDYYESVSVLMLPHVVDRPLSIVRCPAGADEKCFYQKHVTDSMPKHIHGVFIEEQNSEGYYISIDSIDGLISLVQIGALELHMWGCRRQAIEKPDVMVFDLDPAPDIAWKDILEGAECVKEKLSSFGLTSFLKTTGGKGLHVIVPLTPSAGWEDVKGFSKFIADSIVRDEPGKYVATMSKEKRAGKTFVDYLRNARGSTAIAPYSTRAKAGAPIATPIGWHELHELKKSSQFTVNNLRKRLKLNADPWKGYFDVKQMLPTKWKPNRS